MKNPDNNRLPGAVIAGAKIGALAFLTCGVLELWCFAVFPWFFAFERYKHFDAVYSLVLLALYSAVGALAGAICGSLLGSLPSLNSDPALRNRVVSALITTLLLLAMEAGSLNPADFNSTLRFLLSKLLLLGVVLAIVLSFRFRVLRPFAVPAIALSLYMAPLAIAEKLPFGHDDKFFRLGMMALTFVLVLSIGTFLHKLLARKARPLIPLAVFGLAGLAISAVLQPAALHQPVSFTSHPGPKPNVILIVMDTVRADHLSAYGYPQNTTPNLEKFQSQAATFLQAASTGDWTLPSHASMFTGYYAARHGARFNNGLPLPLVDKFDTLAEILSRKGFSTAAVISNAAVVNKSLGLHQGFQHFDQTWNSFVVGWSSELHYCLRATLAKLPNFFPANVVADCRPAPKINAAAFGLLDELKARNRPFFLTLNYMDAHTPYVTRPPFNARFGVNTYETNRLIYNELWADRWAKGEPLSQKRLHDMTSRYDAAITSLDAELGRLFDRLRQNDLFENSLIIVTSDHGEALGEKGHLRHGGMSVYENQVHIPLIVKRPHHGNAEVIRQPVSQVDILPTVMEVLGYEPPKDIDGRSLFDLQNVPDRLVFTESYPQPEVYKVGPKRFKVLHQGALAGNHKFIASSNGKRELYDLEADPREEHNLIAEDRELSSQLDQRLRDWRRATALTSTGAGGKLNQDALDRLKSLGYVGGK